jgi:predicted nucleic acid-binding Zn ribbon protein
MRILRNDGGDIHISPLRHCLVCARRGMLKTKPMGQLMCSAHWAMVPSSVKRQIANDPMEAAVLAFGAVESAMKNAEGNAFHV